MTASTTAPAPTDHLATIEHKLDDLTTHVAALTAEMAETRRRRETYTELLDDLAPVASQAMSSVTRELEALRQRADLSDLVPLLTRLVETAPTLERLLGLLDEVVALADDATPLLPQMMDGATSRLDDLDRKGYFAFAKAGIGVVDQVIERFDESDVEALGENVVTILETVREITQPDMLSLLQHMLDGLQQQRAAVAWESAQPPSLWALSRKLRDPDVRKGMARALDTLGAVSAETSPATPTPVTTHDAKGEN